MAVWRNAAVNGEWLLCQSALCSAAELCSVYWQLEKPLLIYPTALARCARLDCDPASHKTTTVQIHLSLSFNSHWARSLHQLHSSAPQVLPNCELVKWPALQAFVLIAKRTIEIDVLHYFPLSIAVLCALLSQSQVNGGSTHSLILQYNWLETLHSDVTAHVYTLLLRNCQVKCSSILVCTLPLSSLKIGKRKVMSCFVFGSTFAYNLGSHLLIICSPQSSSLTFYCSLRGRYFLFLTFALLVSLCDKT